MNYDGSKWPGGLNLRPYSQITVTLTALDSNPPREDPGMRKFVHLLKMIPSFKT